SSPAILLTCRVHKNFIFIIAYDTYHFFLWPLLLCIYTFTQWCFTFILHVTTSLLLFVYLYRKKFLYFLICLIKSRRQYLQLLRLLYLPLLPKRQILLVATLVLLLLIHFLYRFSNLSIWQRDEHVDHASQWLKIIESQAQ